MASPEKEQIGLPFELYNYYGEGVAAQVSELIEAGKLPSDTFFRLAGVGHQTSEAYGKPHTLRSFTLMADIVRHGNALDKIGDETKELLYGELPDAIVDINSRYNYRSYSMLDPMYYRIDDLANAIHKRRAENGQALAERPFDKRLHTVQTEEGRCRGIARPLWRLLVKRFHPEWLETPSDYYPSSYIGSFCVVYYIGEAGKKRGIVRHAVISDPLVKSIYDEAVTTGVRGIGKVGAEDLRLLLLDEHPELAEGHELAGDVS